MAVSLEQFASQLKDCGILADDTLLDFLPPKANPRSAEELAKELILRKKLTKFQAEEVSKGKGKSLTLGNYVLLEKIGAGGMGQVFKAWHRRMDRLVAVKLLPPTMTKDKAAIARFDREVKAAAKLRHTNIVAADDADEANGVHFLVMELVEGSDLSALVKKNGPLSVDKTLSYIIQAARGLEFAHEHGVIHRDIKPANLLVDAKGTVKILDMGLARIEGSAPGQAELTSSGAIMGTVDYMAPEQAVSTKTADARSDIYSLGISLWYLLTGKCVYDGDTLMAKLLAHRDAAVPSLNSTVPEVSAALDAVFQKMVAKRAQDRYQSMTEVIRDLESCCSGSSVSLGDAATSATDSNLLESPRLHLDTRRTGAAPQRSSKSISAPDAASEATIITNDADGTADSPTRTLPRSTPGRQKRAKQKRKSAPAAWWQDRRVQIGGAAAAVLILLGVFLFSAPEGTLRVEITDPEVEVKVQGTTVTLKQGGAESTRLQVGEKKLQVTRGELSFETKSFVLKKGQVTTVKVELLDDELLATSAGAVLGQKAIPKVKAQGDQGVQGAQGVKQVSWQGWPADAPQPAIAPFDAAQAQKLQAEWAKYLRIDVEYTNTLGMKFVLIPPGEFTMGATPEEMATALKDILPDDKHWRECIKSSAPQHKVILTQPIYLGVKEVTQAEYEKVMGVNPSHFAPTGKGKEAVGGLETAKHAVETVSWNDAAEFCAMLSKQEKLKPFYFRSGETITPLDGTGYRLPSEAEWEFACRAGTATRYWIGDKDEDLVRAGWFGGNSGGRSHAAGELKANPFGLYDIHGNVWEWVQDGWDATWYVQFAAKPAINPSSPFSTNPLRVFRGGGWFFPASPCQTSNRVAFAPSFRAYDFGFRVSLGVDAVRELLKGE